MTGEIAQLIIAGAIGVTYLVLVGRALLAFRPDSSVVPPSLTDNIQSSSTISRESRSSAVCLADPGHMHIHQAIPASLYGVRQEGD